MEDVDLPPKIIAAGFALVPVDKVATPSIGLRINQESHQALATL